MKKQISPKIVSVIFGVLVVCFAIGFYVYAVWTEPSVAPPGGNVAAPLNISNIGQVKEGGLMLGNNSGVVNGLIVRYGNVGIGTTNPAEKLEVNGAVKVGNTTGTNAGTIRWTGTAFEGYNGTTWVPLGGGARFGVWNDRNKDGSPDTVTNDTTYQAQTDGLVIAIDIIAYPAYIWTDGSNPPTTKRALGDWSGGSIICPVRKGDYWKASASAGTIFWLPLGD